jgi:hypothetical protein
MSNPAKTVLAAAIVAIPLAAAVSTDAAAQSGLITRAEELPPIVLSSGQPLADAPYEIEAGKYYRLRIQSDG